MKIFSNRTGGFIPALILAVMMVIGVSAQKTYAQYDDQYGSYGDMSYQNFYDELSPYGQWMNDPQYGYVWSPNVGRDFRPYYSNGYWVMTDYGNMWVSNYSWGWAPFHYGRWTLSNYYGWIWIPGNEWGPAWVTWRQGGGNYGWAPMGPGININISFGSGYNVPNPWWTFIPCANIYSRNFHRYYSPRQTVNIINNTTIINNTYVDARARTTYVTGPRRADVEAATRQRVNVYNVSNRSRAGNASISGRNISVYRPAVRQSTGRGQQAAAPRQVKTLERSVSNTPSVRQSGNNTNNNDRLQDNRSAQPRNQGSGSSRGVQPQNGNSRQVQQDNNARQRNADQLQRNQQQEQQRNQRMQQEQQQRNQQIQQDQLRNQRMQEQQRNQRMQQEQQQRNQQMQQQRMQEQQRNQQMQQQRMQEQQRNQQMQQQRNQQIQQQRSQQRSMQESQPQRVERSAPVQRSAPATDRSARGR